MTYDLILHDKHAIFNPNPETIVLVDTGVPLSFHTQSQFNFEGTNFSTHVNAHGISVADVASLVGTNITTLLGADILSKFKVCLDYHNLKITFEPLQYDIMEGEKVQVKMFQGYMMLPVTINGQSVLGYLDTGAKLSYISASLANGLVQNDGLVDDFYIGIGQYKTPSYNTVATFTNGKMIHGCFGLLPIVISSKFFSGIRQAIIGSDLFFNSKKVWIDYSNNYIHIVE